jgi:hypothetical protein
MQRFTCDCGNALFFDNTKCLKCGQEVGYDPEGRTMAVLRGSRGMRRCANGVRHGVCNWVLHHSEKQGLCPACRLNRRIPDLTVPRNVMLWGRMEAAKRRLLVTLCQLGIPVRSKAEDATAGLAFDIVSAWVDPAVTMGHLNGVITVNLEEADDTYRQINREQLKESTRTLLGHFRHETGHYVWQRFLGWREWADPQRVAFRARFGEEWLDYAQALSAHYQNGAPQGWEQAYITGYAASHPWEDWSETWAHYLQMVEGLETFAGMGMEVGRVAWQPTPFPPEAGALPPGLPQDAKADAAFLTWLQGWLILSTVLNEMSASLGQPALYPYSVSLKVAQKLRLVDHLVKVWGGGDQGKGGR